jgi:uroporphyrinogen-III synthase
MSRALVHGMTRIIVTRPQQQAQPWLAALRELGYEVSALPLIEIHPADTPQDLQALQAAWEELKSWDALMFVSHSAVQGFFKQNQPFPHMEYAQNATKKIANVSTGMPPNLRFWATGPGTVASLQVIGVSADRLDSPALEAEQFDSEALWARVRPQIRSGSRVLIVRGRDAGHAQASRDWLAQQIRSAGGHAQVLSVYERRAPSWSAQQLALCQAWLQEGSIWLWSSSQAVHHLPVSLDVSQARCICTHERIAQTARERGFAVVCTSRPALQDVVASIKSLHE